MSHTDLREDTDWVPRTPLRVDLAPHQGPRVNKTDVDGWGSVSLADAAPNNKRETLAGVAGSSCWRKVDYCRPSGKQPFLRECVDDDDNEEDEDHGAEEEEAVAAVWKVQKYR